MSLIFTKSAAARVMGISASQIVRFEVWVSVCFVIVKGQRPTFVSKKKFYANFAEYRQQQGQELRASGKVTKVSASRYTVDSNRAESGFYLLEVQPDRIVCECRDYRDQVEQWGKGVCKHGYAVMGQLGLGSLQDYLRASAHAQRMIQQQREQRAAA
jgi:hypothetical protein